MDIEAFKMLFSEIISESIERAEERLGRKIPRNIVIELHGAGREGGCCLGFNDAVTDLYLGVDKFFRIIDVSVVKVGLFETIVFVRASAHPPGRWNQTNNDPPGRGPFKLLDAAPIKIFTERI